MSLPHRTMCYFQTEQCVVPKQNNVLFPNKTLRRSQRTKLCHATFERIKPIVPGFLRIVIRFAQIPGRSAEFAQKWRVDFCLNFAPNFFPSSKIFNGLKIARMVPISTIFARNQSRRPDLIFDFFRAAEFFFRHRRRRRRCRRCCRCRCRRESFPPFMLVRSVNFSQPFHFDFLLV